MKKILVLFFLGFSLLAVAQQDAMYSQYMFNTLSINPAFAGSRGVVSATALGRIQWSGIPGAPRTQTFSVHSPIAKQRIGVGLQVFNDRVGITKTTGAFMSYAYRLRLGKSVLSMGLQAGLANFRADYSTVEMSSSLPNGDPSFSQSVNKLIPNFGAGLYLSAKKFYLGLSVPHLVNNSLSDNQFKVTNSFISRQYLQWFASTGYSFDINKDFCLKPSMLLKGVYGAPWQLDVSANLWMVERFAFGMSYRSSADLVFMLEMQATPQFRFGYSYDRGVNGIATFNNGSHEFMLRYEIGNARDKIQGPRTY